MVTLRPAVHDDGDENADIDDLMFGLLAAPARRRVLRHLAGCGGTATTDDLVTATAAAADEAKTDGVGIDRRRDLRVSLQHVHLPKLVDTDLVEVADDTTTVSLSPLGRHLAGNRPRAYNSFDITFSSESASAGADQRP